MFLRSEDATNLLCLPHGLCQALGVGAGAHTDGQALQDYVCVAIELAQQVLPYTLLGHRRVHILQGKRTGWVHFWVLSCHARLQVQPQMGVSHLLQQLQGASQLVQMHIREIDSGIWTSWAAPAAAAASAQAALLHGGYVCEPGVISAQLAASRLGWPPEYRGRMSTKRESPWLGHGPGQSRATTGQSCQPPG